jgi:hypothetical protein
LVVVKDVKNLAAKVIVCMRRSKRLEQTSSCNFEKAEKFRAEQVQTLRQNWFRWMKECGDKPEKIIWSEFAKDKLPKDLTN